METATITNSKIKARRGFSSLSALIFSLILILGLGLSSCEVDVYYDYGYDGRPGQAFLALNWDIDEPEYLDAGTGDIPPVFTWGSYYLANPGYRTLYYEGSHWTGRRWMDYAWEMDYSIHINPGEPGGPYYDGSDGANSYFDLICTPYGPGFEHYDAYYKKSAEEPAIVSDSGTITKKIKNATLTVNYRKVSPKGKPIAEVSK
jgi:hypothetical protein